MAYASGFHVPINQSTIKNLLIKRNCFKQSPINVGFIGRQTLYFLAMLNLGQLL